MSPIYCPDAKLPESFFPTSTGADLAVILVAGVSNVAFGQEEETVHPLAQLLTPHGMAMVQADELFSASNGRKNVMISGR